MSLLKSVDSHGSRIQTSTCSLYHCILLQALLNCPMVVISFPPYLFFISVTCCRMVIDESYESSDVGHGDDGGESDDDGKNIVTINASSKGCF